MKNIIIYTHMENFSLIDGGTVVQYLLAKTLDECGQSVRIYPASGIKTPNSIFSKFYENDFPIDDNSVIIYCEGTQGNPLNGKVIVRWMLSKLGQNRPYSYVDTWGKEELVYYFNSEEKIKNNPNLVGEIYKFLNIIYINPETKNYNSNLRSGNCFTIRKAIAIHGHMPEIVHPPNALEITTSTTQLECIEIFNNKKFFISYDPLTFLTVLAALCGCISIVKKVNGQSKLDWLNTTVASEYLKESGEGTLYGIAYGADDLQNAINSIHLAKDQWTRIVDFSKTKYINKFIEDINNWSNMINTIQNNFY